MKASSVHTPSLKLLSELGDQKDDAAEVAYQHILQRIQEAKTSIEIFMYVWRADAVGHLIGNAIYQAAERGIKIKILKDSGAALFESQENNKKSFFETPQNLTKRLLQRVIGMTFPNSFVKDEWTKNLGKKIKAHPNVEFIWVAPTHTKYYCIDETHLITGSLNLEDRHREYHDVMVEISGSELIEHFRKCQNNPQNHQGISIQDGEIQMLFNTPSKNIFEIKPKVIDLIKSAEKSIHIEMAYLGDEELTQAIIDAGNRGVKLSILLSQKANIGNDINYHVLRQLMEKTKVQVRLSPKMIHSKVLVVDERKTILGSANFSIFSMQRAGEFCLLCEDCPSLIEPLNKVLSVRYEMGKPANNVSDLPHYWHTLACLQQWHQRANKHH